MLFVLFECLCLMFKLIEYCFEINVQGMLGVDSASARPGFDGTTRGLSRISGLSRHVAVVILALVCVGYIYKYSSVPQKS